MALAEKDRFFFIHVMKTGGTSFAEHLRANFTAEQRYPDACITSETGFFDRVEAYLHVPKLVADVNALDGQLRIVLGHVPYSVRSLLSKDYVALTLLRDPVDRTLSFLKHCRRYHIEHMGQALEEIYADAWFHASFMSNYQTKIFSMSVQEALAENRYLPTSSKVPPRSELIDGESFSPEVQILRDSAPGRFSMECFAASTGVINIDEKRLAAAKENLSAVEVVGVTEYYDHFLQQLVNRYNWTITSIPPRHTGEQDAISPEFRNRIASDNIFDIELYEYAKSLSI
jgi:Sulfotransferase family